MKTFLGFTTGLFSGTLIGIMLMSALFYTTEEFRDYMNSLANDTDDT